MSDDEDIVWTTTTAAQLIAWIYVAVGILGPIIAIASLEGDDRVGALGLIPIGLLLAFGAYRLGVHPMIRAERFDLIIRGPFRTLQIPYGSITEVRPGRGGLVIERRRDLSVAAWAVQKSDFIGRRTRADRIAEEIMRRVRKTQAAGGGTIP